MPIRVLIVGCGYVGLALASELVRRGHQVWGLRRNTAAESLPAGAGITLLKADITHLDHLIQLPANYDWVVNCVSSSGGGSDSYRTTYLEGTRNLISWLCHTPPQRFVYTGSTSVYGQDDGSTVSEDAVTDPPHETGKILLETERILLEAAKSEGFPAVILRVAGIYGPDRGYWLKEFLKGTVAIDGGGQRILNMIHRDDVCGAILAALSRGRPGRIYNAVDDEPVTQLDFFQWLSNVLGKPLPPFADTMHAGRKRGSTNKRILNHRLKEELGYQFKYPSFRQGFAEEILAKS